MSLRQSLFRRFLGRLRFPQLFVLVLALFGLDLAIPDVIPFLDEILLGAVTLLLGSWKDRRADQKNEALPDRGAGEGVGDDPELPGASGRNAPPPA